MRRNLLHTFSILIFTMLVSSLALADAFYPQSTYITGMSFDMSTLRNVAPGNGVSAPESDNWAITWADDGHQYTVFGDGVGFQTFNGTRASNGVARIEGGKSNYSAYDVFKTGSDSGGWAGKSLGIISIDGVLWMLRNGTGSGAGAFEQTELYKSTDHGSSWSFTGVRWGRGFFSPTILQFGRDYDGARDNYVYFYGPENTSGLENWDVQEAGEIALFRVPKGSMENQGAYEYFAGMNGSQPEWTSSFGSRKPVFKDSVNGVMRTSVSYNAGLDRYILITQQVARFADQFHIGIYEAPEPWGPWSTILFDNAKVAGPNLNDGAKTVYWNLSNKWLSADGKDFVMVYTGSGPDEWGTVEGRFILDPGGVDNIAPEKPSNLIVE